MISRAHRDHVRPACACRQTFRALWVAPVSASLQAALGLFNRVAQPHAGAVVVEEFNAAFFERRLYAKECPGMGLDGAFKGLHAPDRADGDLRGFCELGLVPAQ
jgi:hypothetical protein